MRTSLPAATYRTFAALGNEHRLRIVELLRDGELCVCEIAPEFKLDLSVVSRHLTALVHAGILRSRRDGRRVLYQIADHRVLKLLDVARQAAEHPDKARPVGSRERQQRERCRSEADHCHQTRKEQTRA